jgi:hypothetical protein
MTRAPKIDFLKDVESLAIGPRFCKNNMRTQNGAPPETSGVSTGWQAGRIDLCRERNCR